MPPDAEILPRDATDDAIVRALARNWHETRRTFARVPTVHLHDTPDAFWFSTGLPSGWFNAVLFTRFTAASADAEIDRIFAHFTGLGMPWLWFIEPGSAPDDLGARLLARGMEHSWDCRNMALALPQTPLAGPLPPDVAILPVTDAATLAMWHTVVVAEDAEVYERGAPSPFVAFRLATAHVPGRQHFVATLAGEPVALATIVPAAGVAGLYGVVTLPAARGRGIGAAITAAALDYARGLGYAVAVLQASPMGHSIYARMGFHDLPVFPSYVWKPPE